MDSRALVANKPTTDQWYAPVIPEAEAGAALVGARGCSTPPTLSTSSSTPPISTRSGDGRVTRTWWSSAFTAWWRGDGTLTSPGVGMWVEAETLVRDRERSVGQMRVAHRQQHDDRGLGHLLRLHQPHVAERDDGGESRRATTDDPSDGWSGTRHWLGCLRRRSGALRRNQHRLGIHTVALSPTLGR